MSKLYDPQLLTVLDDLERALDKAATLQAASLRSIRAAANSVIDELYETADERRALVGRKRAA